MSHLCQVCDNKMFTDSNQPAAAKRSPPRNKLAKQLNVAQSALVGGGLARDWNFVLGTGLGLGLGLRLGMGMEMGWARCHLLEKVARQKGEPSTIINNKC